MWKWLKIPKIGALVAFFLPWLTISCSGSTLVSATGWQLAWGTYSVGTLQGAVSPTTVGQPGNFWLILAIVTVVGGIRLTFLKQSKQESLKVVGTSAIALVLIWVGTGRYSKSALVAAASRGANTGWSGSIDQASTAMTQVTWEIGYFLAISALMTAGVMAWLVYLDKDATVQTSIRNIANAAVASASHSNISDIDLATSERELKPSSDLPRRCPHCGARYNAEQRFCSHDGTALSESDPQ